MSRRPSSQIRRRNGNSLAVGCVTAFGIVLCAAWPAPAAVGAQGTGATVRIVAGVSPGGLATDLWLALLRKRLTDARYEAVAPLRKPLTAEETEWATLIRSRAQAWEREIPPVAELFRPVAPPGVVRVVLGNRGAEDAFTHDAGTIGFDLSALQANYGSARLAVNAARVDRFFRHEFVHVMQKGWLASHPWRQDSPLRAALADIWAEGLGNYYSLSSRWLSTGGRRSETAAGALARLEPRLVARLAALACATPATAESLTADLSWGRFDRKWGALTAALWLEAEPGPPPAALRRFVLAGPEGVWDLADRHLSAPLQAVLAEGRLADSLCAGRAPPSDRAPPDRHR